MTTTSRKTFKQRWHEQRNKSIYNDDISTGTSSWLGVEKERIDFMKSRYNDAEFSAVELTRILGEYCTQKYDKINISTLTNTWTELYGNLNPHTGVSYCTWDSNETQQASLRTWFHQLCIGSQQHYFKGGKKVKKADRIVMFNCPELLKINKNRQWLPLTDDNYKIEKNKGNWYYIQRNNIKSEKKKYTNMLPNKQDKKNAKLARIQGFRNKNFMISEVVH